MSGNQIQPEIWWHLANDLISEETRTETTLGAVFFSKLCLTFQIFPGKKLLSASSTFCILLLNPGQKFADLLTTVFFFHVVYIPLTSQLKIFVFFFVMWLSLHNQQEDSITQGKTDSIIVLGEKKSTTIISHKFTRFTTRASLCLLN